MGVVVKATRTFFDRSAIVRAVGKARAAALAKFGAYVRTAARGSMRRNKSPSRPGQPPRAVKGQLKNLLYFSYDRATRSVVAGPVPFAAGTAPRVLELGGTLPTRRNSRRGRLRVGKSGPIRTGGARTSTTRDVPMIGAGGGTVEVTFGVIRTAAQLAAAERIEDILIGPKQLPSAKLEARPYMGPALQKTLPKLPPLWANAVT